MADKDIQITQRNATNDGWDNINPITKSDNVKIVDVTTATKYVLKINNGQMYIEEVAG